MQQSTIDREELHKEIERKFVPSAIPEEILVTEAAHMRIAQGYLAKEETCVVRLRAKGDKFYITYKSSKTSYKGERIELETEITEPQFNVLWPGTEGRRVEKMRHIIPFGEYTIELDRFEGANAGHLLLEVEFPSVEEAVRFTPPSWFGREVTGDKRYSNSTIAENGFPTGD